MFQGVPALQMSVRAATMRVNKILRSSNHYAVEIRHA